MRSYQSMAILITAAAYLHAPHFANAVEIFDSETPASFVDPSCRQNESDPFDLGWRFAGSSLKFSHQCINSLGKRPIKITRDSDNEMIFANVLHGGKYWTAHWRAQNRPTVQYFGVHFDAGVPMVTAGHTELHFVFPEGIELVAQTGLERTVIKNLVVAWEANFPPNVRYNVVSGILPSYAISGRVVSLESRIPENILPNGKLRQTDVFDLRLTPSEGAALFQESLRRSERFGYSRFYRTLGPNCTSELFDVIDQVLRDSRPEEMAGIPRFKTLPSPDPILGPGRAALVQRGLIDSDTQPLDLGKLTGH